MTHQSNPMAAFPPQPGDKPRPQPVGKPPTPSGVFDMGDDDDELTPEEETMRFLRLLPYCGLHGSPFRPRLTAAELLQAEAKIFYCR